METIRIFVPDIYGKGGNAGFLFVVLMMLKNYIPGDLGHPLTSVSMTISSSANVTWVLLRRQSIKVVKKYIVENNAIKL
jgi:hypothetical protein